MFLLNLYNCKYYTTHLQILTAAINGKNALHKECVLRKLLNLRTTLRENTYAKQIAQWRTKQQKKTRSISEFLREYWLQNLGKVEDAGSS